MAERPVPSHGAVGRGSARARLRGAARGAARAALATTTIDAALSVAAAGLERSASRTPWQLPVLTYHRVDEPGHRPDLYPGLLSATPAVFEAQMRHLAGRHRVLALEELVDLRQRAARPPDRAIAVTFDDGYRDLGEVAWPILRRLGLPATVFVPTAFPGTGRVFWWDRLWAALAGAPAGTMALPDGRAMLSDEASRLAAFRAWRAALKSLPHDRLLAEVDRLSSAMGGEPRSSATLDWEELRALAADGLAVAPHSRSHPLLTRVDPATLADELAGGRADLAERLGVRSVVTAYPSGAHDDAVVRAAADAGYELAFTTERGGNDLRRADWLRLRRFNIGRATTTALLRLEVLPWPRREVGRQSNR
jgi:peptidoglycan/xylan/chitin deacetylase (PgdA/CDA1 family)